MVRSLNIQKTDQLVWGILKSVLQQIRHRSPASCNPESNESPQLDDRGESLSDGLPWMSPDQIDLLSDEDKRQVIKTTIKSIRAYLDVDSGKHRVDVEFSADVTRLLATECNQSTIDKCDRNRSETLSEAFCGVVSNQTRGSSTKQSDVSTATTAADSDYSVTVE